MRRSPSCPRPTLAPVGVPELVRRVAGLETRIAPVIVPGPEIVIQADADQLEQLLINVIRNAADASLETGGGVRVGWDRQNSHLMVWVRDEGHGLAEHRQSVRAVLHHQAHRIGHRAGAEPPDRRGARRNIDAAECFGGSGVRGAAGFAAGLTWRRIAAYCDVLCEMV